MIIIIIIIIQNLYSAIMPLGGYRGTKWLRHGEYKRIYTPSLSKTELQIYDSDRETVSANFLYYTMLTNILYPKQSF